MSLVSRSPARLRRRRWTTLAGGSAAIVVASLLVLRPGAATVLWALLAAALVAHWAGRRASDCTVLVDLGALPVGDIATPLAVVPARSATPLLDLARLRAAGGGVVLDGDDARVLTERRVEQLGIDLVLSGHWDELAVLAVALPADLAADHLRRLPDEDEVWVVRTRGGVRMVSGDGLRAAAAATRKLRAVRPAPGPAVSGDAGAAVPATEERHGDSRVTQSR